MRIKCVDIGDFIVNLESAETVYRKTVFFNRTRRPLGADPETTSFEIYFQLSAVLQFSDGSDALLEAGELCGIDRLTADGETEGTDKQAKLNGEILAYCKANSLTMLPGILDL